jgi:hypothetical protein
MLLWVVVDDGVDVVEDKESRTKFRSIKKKKINKVT